MAALALRDVVKVYGRQLAVRGIDLDSPDKAFLAIAFPTIEAIGPNNATMRLRMMATKGPSIMPAIAAAKKPSKYTHQSKSM